MSSARSRPEPRESSASSCTMVGRSAGEAWRRRKVPPSTSAVMRKGRACGFRVTPSAFHDKRWKSVRESGEVDADPVALDVLDADVDVVDVAEHGLLHDLPGAALVDQPPVLHGQDGVRVAGREVDVVDHQDDGFAELVG